MKGQQQEKNQRIQEICSPVEDSDCAISHGRSCFVLFFFLEGCIMLHSVSALPVQARGMEHVVTSSLYSVTKGNI